MLRLSTYASHGAVVSWYAGDNVSCGVLSWWCGAAARERGGGSLGVHCGDVACLVVR